MKGKKPIISPFYRQTLNKNKDSFSLVAIDDKKIRQNWQIRYLYLQKELENVQSKLQKFLSVEKPQYTIWLESTFPKETAELKDIELRINDLKQFIFEVELDSLLHNRSVAISYHFLLQKKNKKLSNIISHVACADSLPNNEKTEEIPDNNRKRNPRESKIKAAFRTIARLLHPDANNSVSPEKMERWYAAQMAYKAKDLELLESLCYLEEKQTEALPIALIQKRIVVLDKTLQKKKKELEGCLGHPAWGFSQCQIDRQYVRKIKIWINEKIKEKKKELNKLNDKMRGWKLEANRVLFKNKTKKKRSKKKLTKKK
ncbi:hypothetical protein A7K93_03835 [Candidatus Methylacidiphilum fumarolicum]|uniref:J domain-containing protein n=2 Tax=Candidatus Methylacidiphilum fumarolicum TaxID=591154 RepID=I0K1A2_METFB|nr:hypothetical protein [Candidatus Methylacidiphilum fumarolicum]TFE70340.1 hypothetical protein A7K73_03985 [Candidatus Methylacidiphilum fumarolicum]TFE73979.1 hypothetical protein A7K72_05175 [Candidatus Methylacidiphilum fumarolicum]TFE74486.1 hypothetical protein A7K93_03835 [Candidatus Methylacidiphilum fumarolicum]TFE77852.1 hypothetical protein A7D33_02550 [Candidatus Methylacidiphilum fumarolicum]CAI9086790.1 conserved protein of unknown function [Candidatus Methylacidiphilum fumarol